MNFASPEFLFFLALLPLGAFIYRAVRRKFLTHRVPLFSSEAASRFASHSVRILAVLPSLLILAALVSLIVAFANPQGEIYVKKEVEKGNRYSLAFDVSGSMMGANLENAKKAAKELVEKNPNDPFSILPFRDTPEFHSGTAFTTDRALIIEAIERMNATGSTAVGSAILGAAWNIFADLHTVHNLKERGVRLPSYAELLDVLSEGDTGETELLIRFFESNFPSREGSIIIAITDAGSNTGLPMKTAIRFAGDFGISVYLIGVDVGAYTSSELAGQLKNTGGGYFSAEQSDEIVELYRVIDSLNPVVIQTVMVPQQKSFRLKLALAAFLCLLFAFVIRHVFLVVE